MALDRHEFVERKAYDAQIAHDNNDVGCCFAAVRALHGGKPRAHNKILKKVVKKLKTSIIGKKGGRNIGLRFSREASLNFIVIDLLKVARMNITCRLKRWVSIVRCRRLKATGCDLLSNEVMQTGGRPMTELASE